MFELEEDEEGEHIYLKLFIQFMSLDHVLQITLK